MEKDEAQEETYIGVDGKIYPKIDTKTHVFLSNLVLQLLNNQDLEIKVDILAFCLSILMTDELTKREATIVLDGIKSNLDYMFSETFGGK